MDNLFNGVASGAEVTAPATTPEQDNRKAKVQAMKESLRQTVMTDSTYMERLRRWSNSIEVVNSLGFGDSGNIVVDKSASTKDQRKLAVTSAIVGYRVANVGEEPIKYVTEVWAPDESGKFVATKQERVLSPGGTADLTRQYMTIFCSQPEISFTLRNGKIIKGSGAKGDKGPKAELESFYFSFSKEEDGSKKQINDDEIKLNVAEKVGDVWKVKAEFEETFGFLNNAKEGGRGGHKSSSKFTAQDVAANYIFQMLKKEQSM